MPTSTPPSPTPVHPVDDAGYARRYPKDRYFLTSDGATIAYTILNPTGTGLPLVFIPGLCCTDTYLAPIAGRLVAAGHPAIILDNRGHFDSKLPAGAGVGGRGLSDDRVSMARLGTDIAELLAESGFGRAALIGHSLGVQILFEAYRAAGPKRVAALIPIAGTYENPIGTFAGKDLNGAYRIFDRIRPWLPLQVMGPALARIGDPELGVRFVRLVKAGGDRVTAAVLAPHIERIGEVDFAYIFRLTRSMWQHSAADLLPGLEVPLLVCAGELDLFTPPVVQRQMAELAPDSELLMFDTGTHFLPVDHPDELTAGIGRFLSERVR